MPRYDIYKSFREGRDFGHENFTAERTPAAVCFHFLCISEKCSLMIVTCYSRNTYTFRLL